MKIDTDNSGHVSSIGGCWFATKDSQLPFTHIEIWTRLQIQSKAYHHPHNVLPPQTINATLPSSIWPIEQYDMVITNTDPAKEWPFSEMTGKLLTLFGSLIYIDCQLIQDIMLFKSVLYSEFHHQAEENTYLRWITFYPMSSISILCLKWIKKWPVLQLYMGHILSPQLVCILSEGQGKWTKTQWVILFLWISFRLLSNSCYDSGSKQTGTLRKQTALNMEWSTGWINITTRNFSLP